MIKKENPINNGYFRTNMNTHKNRVKEYLKNNNKELEFVQKTQQIEEDVIKLAQDFKYDFDIEKVINQNVIKYKINFKFICNFTELDIKKFYIKNIILFALTFSINNLK